MLSICDNNKILQMDIEKCIQDVKALKCLDESTIKMLCKKTKEILIEQSNLQPIRPPIVVCGDLHGQFFDLLKLFSLAGSMPETCYLFMGDFVDRGYNSVELLILLLLLKNKYPESITLLRGNHESRQISTTYGFYEEVLQKYGNSNVWKYCNDVFDYLPLAALIGDDILCVHGGMSPSIKALDQIRQIDRRCEIPTQGPFCDLMWSDPEDIDTWAPNRRGAGWLFGEKVVEDFCRFNEIKLIARSHQLVQEGYQEWFSKKKLVTVWSAPNYCYRCGNLASFLKINETGNIQYETFKADDRSKDSKNYKQLIPYFL